MECPVCHSDLPEGALFCGDCGSSVNAVRLARTVRDARPSDTTVIGPVSAAPQPQPLPRQSASAGQGRGEPEFVLMASTGERVAVGPGGLLGRRPIPQPGETPDRLVALADRGRSVSKTHLEFGLEAGNLWICDRYSANGSTIITADGSRRPCQPGVRYRVERGSRIEIGDQHLTVS